jgi:hypothetical protein
LKNISLEDQEGNKIELCKGVSENGRCIEEHDQIISSGFVINGIELSDSATISLGICVTPKLSRWKHNFVLLLALGRVQIFY